MEKAFITFLSNDAYFKYVLALHDSWKKTNSKYSFYCMITSGVSEYVKSCMDKVNLKYIYVDTSDLTFFTSRQKNGMSQKFYNAMNKLKIFTLTQFEKCVYLDADMIICKNIDELMDKPDWTAVEGKWDLRDWNTYNKGGSLFNSGMFVFTPNLNFYNLIISDARAGIFNPDIGFHGWHDQAILAYYNQTWLKKAELHLSNNYNCLIRDDVLEYHKIDQNKSNELIIKHFVVKDCTNLNTFGNIQTRIEQKRYFDYMNKIIDENNFLPSWKINYSGEQVPIITDGSKELKKVIGVISWFPNESRDRYLRQKNFNNFLSIVEKLFPTLDILVVAQNWQNFQPLQIKNKMNVFKYNQGLGILKARKTLRELFLNTKYDYLLMADDDCVVGEIQPNGVSLYLKEIDKHPNGFTFLGNQWGYYASQLNFCAISRFIYEREPMTDVDPQKGEGHEDNIFSSLLHYKWSAYEFNANYIKCSHYHNGNIENVSTWEGKGETTSWWFGGESINSQCVANDRKFIDCFKKGNYDIEAIKQNKVTGKKVNIQEYLGSTTHGIIKHADNQNVEDSIPVLSDFKSLKQSSTSRKININNYKEDFADDAQDSLSRWL